MFSLLGLPEPNTPNYFYWLLWKNKTIISKRSATFIDENIFNVDICLTQMTVLESISLLCQFDSLYTEPYFRSFWSHNPLFFCFAHNLSFSVLQSFMQVLDFDSWSICTDQKIFYLESILEQADYFALRLGRLAWLYWNCFICCGQSFIWITIHILE